MPHNRFYYPNLDQQTIILKENEFHHLAHVMKVKENEVVEVVDGKGSLVEAKVEKIERSQALLNVLKKEQFKKLNYHLSVAIACPKFSHLEIALEKCTEIGADEFILFESQFSEKLYDSEAQKKRIENILISAMKQCGRYYLPALKCIKDKNYFITLNPTKLLCSLTEETKKIKDLKLNSESVTIIIGPEKGFSESDTIFFINEAKAIPVTLSPNILRMETACIASTAQIIQYLDQNF